MYQQAGMSALWGVIHLLRVMVNRGLVSPNEVETIYEGMREGFDTGDPAVAEIADAHLQPAFADLRRTAKEKWIGGNHDPETRDGGRR